MKHLFFVLALFAALGAAAQGSNSTRPVAPALDKSPMDMAYYPVNYPMLKVQDKAAEPLLVRAIYSRPLKNGRNIFGDLVPYNEVWRLGANEATEVEFFRDVRVGGKKLAKGKYTLYAIATPQQWTLIFNKETDTWGAFKYDEKKDVARVTVPVETLSESLEPFTLYFEKTAAGPVLVVAWDTQRVTLPIAVK
ncbi:DUF2911 domain-containing protein [Flaviaesturariibacter aridisoli]|uniref:DUF2911 domain-containing protein n=1 Tax=Flaviaesturariibacter aridisoli TaxID=2545761 RepID=A0A4R4E018_9BACT|nr:DUF2911 domain-containing protein [Flaviaesturariibacter aridisoli]TCZ67084.1 DUF2911 domain-containing protein [Flaviaesturariibacter aridisoli]